MGYPLLEQHFRDLGHLQHVTSIMYWDEAVVMPSGAGAARAEAMATLQVLMHRYLTDPRLAEWFAAAAAQGESLSDFQRANLSEIERQVRRAQAIPADLVARAARATMACNQGWRTMRAENDWSGFSPLLTEVLAIKREQAAVLGEALGLSGYDALMDEFEPGARAHRVDAIFAQLRSFLPALTERILEHQRGRPSPIPLRGPFPLEEQRRLGKHLIEMIGFDPEHGRVDTSHHPFCGGVPTDVRITTRYDEADFSSALMGLLHEAGHAKYEQGLPRQWLGQPVGAARGMSIHESQSLLQEMQIARGRDFLEFAAPIIADAFPAAAAGSSQAFTAENLHRLYTRVERGLIRVDADEVTYPSHVLLRYGLERALIDGKMEVCDIPEAWDAGMQELLGIRTEFNYRDGCMQDVHWSEGAFGYFPTYTLGALSAAQIFAAARRELPELSTDIRGGRYGRLNSFLRERIWKQASLLSVDELMVRATGEALNPEHFRHHLHSRYLQELG